MLLAILMFSIGLIVAPIAKAEDSVVARIWTDKPDYSPGETVIINGTGFLASNTIYINVTRPNSSVNSGDNTTSDAEGNFTTTYLLDGITGTYTVTVTDGTNTATTTFTDTTLYEYHNTGDNSAGSFWGNVWYAQTFTVGATSHTVTSVKLKLARKGSPGIVTVSIRATSGLLPTGADLTSGTINGNSLISWTSGSAWYEIALTSYALSANTKYAIVVRAPNGDSNNCLFWRTGGSSPTYAGGNFVYSTNGGGSWGSSTSDQMFEVWGNPPPSQYYLTVNSDHDTPIGSGWYDAGTTAYAKLLNGLVTSGETRWVFTGWSGDASGTGLTSNPIIMDCPKTAVVEWKTQYWLSVIPFPFPFIDTPSGDGWYDAGSIAYASVSDYAVPDVEGYQWAFSYWTFDASGTNLTSDPIIMDGPKLAVPVWDYQVYLTVNSGHGVASGEGWYNLGDTATVDAVQNVDEVAGQSRYDFRSWIGAAPTGVGNRAEVLMDCPKTATANYQLQYKITFAQTGVGTDFTGTMVIIDGTYYDRNDASFWWDENSVHTFSFASPLSVGGDKQYVWTSTTELSTLQSSSLTITASGSVTGNYKAQYYLTVKTEPLDVAKISGEGWYDYCTEVTLTAPLESNITVKYHFANWNVSNDGFFDVFLENSIKVHMDEPKTATAVYKDYLGHAKEENADLRTYLQNLYDTSKIDKKEYNHFLKDLDKVEKDVDKAIKNLDTARVGYDDKMKGFEDLRHAVMKLKHMIKDVKDWAKKDKIPAADATLIINELETIRMKFVDKAWAEALAERALALKAIEDAKALGKNTTKAEKEIAKVDCELAKAEQKITEGKLSQAIQHFKHAFAHSHHAIKKAYDPTWTIDYKDWIDELEEDP